MFDCNINEQFMRNDRDNIIVNRAIEFSLAVMRYCEFLMKNQKYIIAKQLFRSATAIGANILEAQNAESKADFIHKMKIAAKEASETKYWLTLCECSKDYGYEPDLGVKLEAIIRILSKIISSSKGVKI